MFIQNTHNKEKTPQNTKSLLLFVKESNCWIGIAMSYVSDVFDVRVTCVESMFVISLPCRQNTNQCVHIGELPDFAGDASHRVVELYISHWPYASLLWKAARYEHNHKIVWISEYIRFGAMNAAQCSTMHDDLLCAKGLCVWHLLTP